MDLVALADFNLVAKHGGFGRAARASLRPKASLSRRVADLEASLNMRLFERGSRQIKLTEEGRALFERTSFLLTEIGETAATIASRSHTPRGTLRMSAPLLFCQVAMGKIAAEFALKYPEVRLEVTTDDRTVDLVEEGYDLVIRVNPRSDDRLVGRNFLHDRLVVVARQDVPRPAQGQPVRGIAGPIESGNRWQTTGPDGPETIEFEPIVTLSSMIMVRDAVRTGVGAARLPLSLVSHDVADGSLVKWGKVDTDTQLWALYPSRRLLSARVSAFLEYLKTAFPQGTPEELAAYIGR